VSDTLVEMDRTIASEFGEHRFVTAQLAVIDLASGVLTLLNAGHPPPVLLRDGVDAGDLPAAPSLPIGLGVVPTSRSVVSLQPGDVVVFYTDGVTEARDEGGEFFGRRRLVSTIEASMHAREPPAETLRIVAREVAAFQSGKSHDDATVLLVSWRPVRR
jgi:serine phosphatase RsbU (regulator of sigma subunit)